VRIARTRLSLPLLLCRLQPDAAAKPPQSLRPQLRSCGRCQKPEPAAVAMLNVRCGGGQFDSDLRYMTSSGAGYHRLFRSGRCANLTARTGGYGIGSAFYSTTARLSACRWTMTGAARDLRCGRRRLHSARGRDDRQAAPSASRSRLPFKRESAETAAQPQQPVDGPVKSVTVPGPVPPFGNCTRPLRGTHDALCARLRGQRGPASGDPDLIYPGQGFAFAKLIVVLACHPPYVGS